jgi:hypothetical protein
LGTGRAGMFDKSAPGTPAATAAVGAGGAPRAAKKRQVNPVS